MRTLRDALAILGALFLAWVLLAFGEAFGLIHLAAGGH
jgi:hypothetical protein